MVFKRLGGVNEEFFSFFCSVGIYMVWILCNFVFLLSPGKMNINYYMCTGEDPALDPYKTKKVYISLKFNSMN